MRMRMAHGPAIRAIREALGIKHGKFAVECGISPGYLTNVEKGVKQPSEAVVSSIAARLGVTKDEITYVITAEATAGK
ncbi:helix-turn-helix transcriptional regulator [Arthrobacter sp. 1P04PC]|uniref:helix-turn-helix domain-containing protein n=1 Tax=unclassified Arthrobacter TaxID=235627 RepID=UPI0039A2F969